MKYLLLALLVVGFTSCNTAIGLGRDTKMGFQWANQKIQNMNTGEGSGGGGGGGGYDDGGGAPVY